MEQSPINKPAGWRAICLFCWPASRRPEVRGDFGFAASALGALGVLAAFEALNLVAQKKPAWMRAICLVAGAGFEPAAFRL